MAKKRLPKLNLPGDALDKIVLLLVSLQSASSSPGRMRGETRPDRGAGRRGDRHARAKIVAAAEVDRDKARGQAIVRLTDLYERALKVQDVKAALAARRN